MPASDYPDLRFSDDGANVIALITDPDTSLRSMYGATVGVAGSLKQLATGLAFGRRHDRRDGRSCRLFPVPG